MRFITFLLCFLFAIQHNKGYELKYDQLKNQTIASTSAIEIKLNDDYLTKSFDLKVQCIFEGVKPLDRPGSAYLVFRTLSHRWRFLEEPERQVKLWVNGMSVEISSKPTYTSVIGEKFLDETLSYQVKMSDVEMISRASKIEIQIGGVGGQFKDKQLNKIKEFLRNLPTSNSNSFTRQD